ncbi:MAG: protein translocase subunit SecF, partial [Terracidiphilus sp.]
MELFHGVNVDWLGKKWYFLAFSMIFSVAGIVSMGWHWAHIHSPVPLGVDFRGGTEIQVQFTQPPDINAIRRAT